MPLMCTHVLQMLGMCDIISRENSTCWRPCFSSILRNFRVDFIFFARVLQRRSENYSDYHSYCSVLSYILLCFAHVFRYATCCWSCYLLLLRLLVLMLLLLLSLSIDVAVDILDVAPVLAAAAAVVVLGLDVVVVVDDVVVGVVCCCCYRRHRCCMGD